MFLSLNCEGLNSLTRTKTTNVFQMKHPSPRRKKRPSGKKKQNSGEVEQILGNFVANKSPFQPSVFFESIICKQQ